MKVLFKIVLFLTIVFGSSAFGQVSNYKIISGYYIDEDEPLTGELDVILTDTTITIFLEEYFGNTYPILYTEETCETYSYITGIDGVVINFLPAYGIILFHGYDGKNEVLIEAKIIDNE